MWMMIQLKRMVYTFNIESLQTSKSLLVVNISAVNPI